MLKNIIGNLKSVIDPGLPCYGRGNIERNGTQSKNVQVVIGATVPYLRYVEKTESS